MAGFVAALELLQHLEKGRSGEVIGRDFLRALRADVSADRQELKTVMDRLRIVEHEPRKAAAWLAEKLTEFELRLDDPGDGALRLLEAIEGLSLGIEGKRLLWTALSTAAEEEPRLRGFDFGRLEQRAVEQRQRLEGVRLQASRTAVGVTS